jgi:hypothetical protein
MAWFHWRKSDRILVLTTRSPLALALNKEYSYTSTSLLGLSALNHLQNRLSNEVTG